MSDDQQYHFSTRAIRAGQEFDPTTGAVVPPVYMTSTFVQDGIGGFRGGYEYARGGNPTRDSLQELLASLEGGRSAFSFASGLAAEDALLRAVLKPGDHIVMGNDVYGGTHRLVSRVFVPWGVSISTVEMSDLDAVRQALGVDKVNLVGASYGTRVAQRYAGAYPQHTRSVVIDGVVPNELVVGGDFANTFENAISLQSAQCRKDAACRKRFPTDTRAQLRNVVDTLRRTPVTVDYRDPGTSAPRQDVLTPDSVVGPAFAFSYVPQYASLLPLVLDEAAHGRYAPLASLVRGANRSMDFQINRAMQWSVICSEDAPRYQAPAGSDDRLFGNEVASAFFAACPVWPHQPAPAANAAPLRSEVPALLLSGELDPVTPPRYAEQVLKGLPNGRALVARGQGHGTLAAGCMPRLLGQFIDSTDAGALDAGCLDTLSYVPAFTSFNGWEP